MGLTQLAVFVLVLGASTCRGEIVIKVSQREKIMARLSDDVANIVTSCYKGQINGVVLAGNLPSTLSKTLSVQHSIPVALLDMRNVEESFEKPTRYRHKLNVFIIKAFSDKNLGRSIIHNIKCSIWWNHMASFFILDVTPDCYHSRRSIVVGWLEDILNAKVMCYRNESETIIYNLNPFTSRAPTSWQQLSVVPGLHGNPITMFTREYQGNKTICLDLDFDKMEDLGGFKFKVRKFDPYTPKETIRTNGDFAFRTTLDRITGTIYHALNVTPRYTNSKTFRDFVELPTTMYDSWSENVDLVTYPHIEIPIHIVTSFRGLKSQLNKIISVIDVDSRYGMGVVYLITLIFLKCFVHQSLVPALLNLLRMTCNTGFTNIPNNTASRIYLGCLLFFVVTMQGIFQGDLASLLTKQISVRNVETIQDLKDMGYKEIRGSRKDYLLLDDLDLKQIFIYYEHSKDCLTAVINNLSVACITTIEGSTYDSIRDLNLHVSRRPIQMEYIAFRYRWDWVLEEKLNSIIARMVEARVLELWEVKCYYHDPDELCVDPAVKKNVDFKNIQLQEMTFAFVILGIGLACATVVFIIELAIVYKCVPVINIQAIKKRRSV